MCRDMVKYQHSQPAIQTPVQLSISDDTIRTLRLANERMREILAWIEEYFVVNVDGGGRHGCPYCYVSSDGKKWAEMSHADGCLFAALSTPDDGLWREVRWLLENAPLSSPTVPDMLPGSLRNEWNRRCDALLGGKP